MTQVKEVATVEYEVRPRTIFRPPVYYPESDGEPMGETDVHINLLTYLREALLDYFRDEPHVYVAGNLFVYYEEGDPSAVVAPDIFVVKGAPKRIRRTYQVWKEHKGPDVVFELTSLSTRKKDLGPKKGVYEMLGVKEYFVFDPFGEYLDPKLGGFRLTERGEYQRIKGEEPLVSWVLGLELRVEGEMLRLVDPATGEKLLTPLEAQESRRAEAQARQQAEVRARQAEAEVERLRAELTRLRAAEEA